MSTFRGGASLSTFLTFVFWSWSCAFFGFACVFAASARAAERCPGDFNSQVLRAKWNWRWQRWRWRLGVGEFVLRRYTQ